MIDLYLQYSCPFCLKVINAIEPMGLAEGQDYQIIRAEMGTMERLKVQQLGGKSMVPFLVDGDHRMYESDDIIKYLREKFNRP